jgi:hypothetical protein
MLDSLDPLHTLDEDRVLLQRCLTALETTNLAVERADLARVTALLAARYENVLADALYPQIVDSLGTQSTVERAEYLLARVRHDIAQVRTDVHGVAPINAHLSDPDGLEEDINSMTASLRSLLDYEDAELFKLVDLLHPHDKEKLSQRIVEATGHQTSLPDPPDNGLIRKLAEARESIGLALNDHSTTWHPGVEAVLDGPEGA